MATLFQLLVQVARYLPGTRISEATGGALTYLDDTKIIGADDYHNNGTLLIRTGNNQNKSLVVTDWDGSDHRFSHATQILANVAGNKYMYVQPAYTREMMVSAANMVLSDYGAVININDELIQVTDATAADTYPLPNDTDLVSNVRRVQLAMDDADPYYWGRPHCYWREIGTNIIFDTGHCPALEGCPIRLYWTGEHAVVQDDVDIITPSVKLYRIAVDTAFHIMFERNEKYGKSDLEAADALGTITILRDKAIKKYPVMNMPRDPHYSIMS